MKKVIAMKFFLNNQQQLRSIWWIVVFFLVLATFTFPLLIFSQRYAWEVTIAHQAIVVVAATWICQLLLRKPMSELLGAPGVNAIKNCLLGLVTGALLMLTPALFLSLFGYIKWQQGTGDVSAILNISGVFLSVAIAEEFLFRGFVFQRLRKCTGVWIAQLLIAAYFLLTRINNPGMTGSTKMLASVNIFIASVLFGFAYLKTNSLIMPIAMHFMANWVQGTLLGFGVSRNEQPGLYKPVFSGDSNWLTGGNFGLEASVPGLICVVVTGIIFYYWKPVLPGGQISSAMPTGVKTMSN